MLCRWLWEQAQGLIPARVQGLLPGTLSLPENKNRGFHPVDGKILPEQGRLLPGQGRPLREQGKPLPEQGRLLPAQERLCPEQGRNHPEQGRLVPEKGRLSPGQGRPFPEEGKVLPQDGSLLPNEGRFSLRHGRFLPAEKQPPDHLSHCVMKVSPASVTQHMSPPPVKALSQIDAIPSTVTMTQLTSGGVMTLETTVSRTDVSSDVMVVTEAPVSVKTVVDFFKSVFYTDTGNTTDTCLFCYCTVFNPMHTRSFGEIYTESQHQGQQDMGCT